MRSSAGPAEWHLATGTARGRSHQVRDLPSQDAVAHATIPATGGTVVAVADGHGHERHFRSGTGSALAVRAACQVASDHAAALAAAAAGHAGVIRDALPSAILSAWRAEVAGDISKNPYTAEERSVLENDGDGPEVPYGSTLLVALVTNGWLTCVQIGDGDLVAVHPDGAWDCPVPEDVTLDGLHTTSLCQPTALDAFRVGMRDLAAQPLLALLLASDGYANAQAADPWQPQFALDMAELAASHDPGWFAQQVPAWAELCASGEGSGDDTTIALLLADHASQPADEGAGEITDEPAARLRAGRQATWTG